jgi:hypothetical protein
MKSLAGFKVMPRFSIVLRRRNPLEIVAVIVRSGVINRRLVFGIVEERGGHESVNVLYASCPYKPTFRYPLRLAHGFRILPAWLRTRPWFDIS